MSINRIAIWNLYVLMYSEPDYFKKMEYSIAAWCRIKKQQNDFNNFDSE